MSRHEQISPRQLWATLLAAASVPAFGLCVGLGWAQVLAGGVLAAAALTLLFRLFPTVQRLAKTGKGRLLLLPGAGVCLLLAAWTAGRSAEAFPETADSRWSGLLVLALAAWIARQDGRILVRSGAVLAPVLGVLFGALLLSALGQADPAWMQRGEPDRLWTACSLLLTPAMGLCLAPRLQNGRTAPGPGPMALLALVPAGAAALTSGCLGAKTAAEPGSFHLLAQSVSILGVMHRFEAMASAAELTGCCLLCALALTALYGCLKELLPAKAFAAGKWVAPVLCAGLVYPVSRVKPALVFSLNAISCAFWIVMILGIEIQKKLRKSQKKC